MEILSNFNQKALERCQKYLLGWTDEHISFILERLIGILKGVEKADVKSVDLYLRKVEGITMAINRIKWEKLELDYVKELLKELTGERACAMGMAVKVGDSYTPTDLDFPRHVMDFKIFYQVLVQVCKIAIAKHDLAAVQAIIDEHKNALKINEKKITADRRRLTLLTQMHSFVKVDDSM